MWLTVLFNTKESKGSENYANAQVIINDSRVIHSNKNGLTYRTSPIFPIVDNNKIELPEQYSIFFYNYDNPYSTIGELRNNCSSLRKKIWINVGLSSIVLITEDPSDNELLKNSTSAVLRTSEEWTILNGTMVYHDHQVHIRTNIDLKQFEIAKYGELNLQDRVAIDEFTANINLIIPKIAIHNPKQLDVYYQLVKDINELIDELVFVKTITPYKEIPSSLKSEYSTDALIDDIGIRDQIYHQNLERIIQVNSALSYISTQFLSGAVPILERRSLVRRFSLLGIGNAAMALNRMAGSIEDAISLCPLKEIFEERLIELPILKGSEKPISYNSKKWNEYSLGRWSNDVNNENKLSTKIPFFSGRLGFRETEYTISAAIQCISSAANLDWNLITLSHEMMHNHVREILGRTFYGALKSNRAINRDSFYNRFLDHLGDKLDDLRLIDSIRNLIFTYVCYTDNHGSITKIPNGKIKRDNQRGEIIGASFNRLSKDLLWNKFQSEYRNINEIIVHVLDFKYFYNANSEIFILLVWKSWAALPFIHGDIRQYILRSLLVISIEFNEQYDIITRFKASKNRFMEIIDKFENKFENSSVVFKIRDYIDKNSSKLILPFKASLVLVDLADKVFFSKAIKKKLLDDDNVDRIDSDNEFFEDFVYQLPEGFHNVKIGKPLAFLLDRYTRSIDQQINDDDIESLTVRYFLACNSYDR